VRVVRLHVNIDHVATLRQARGTSYPDPVWAAATCELAGAHGITCHLREDRRHITDRDVELLKRTVRTALNLEMATTEEMIAIALRVRPDIVTLVPERREERTTEGGLDVGGAGATLKDAVARLEGEGIQVSLFVDPVASVLRAAAATRATRIELSTARYCEARGAAVDTELEKLALATEEAIALGLHVAGGHGLDYPTVAAVAAIPGMEELNIGHAIIARSIFAGLDRAVRDMLALCRPA
jgi:pyridoxine 5-phosphate synthase